MAEFTICLAAFVSGFLPFWVGFGIVQYVTGSSASLIFQEPSKQQEAVFWAVTSYGALLKLAGQIGAAFDAVADTELLCQTCAPLILVVCTLWLHKVLGSVADYNKSYQ